jgi:hypothetical protein
MPPAVRVLFLTLIVLATFSVAGSEPFLIAERAWSAEPVDVIGGGEDGFYAFGSGMATHIRPDGTPVAATSHGYGFDRSVAVADGVAVVVYQHGSAHDAMAFNREGAVLWAKNGLTAHAVVFDGTSFVTVAREFGKLRIDRITPAGRRTLAAERFVEEGNESRPAVAAALTNNGLLMVWSTASSVKAAFYRGGEIEDPFVIAPRAAQVSMASNGSDVLVLMADAEHLLYGVRLDTNGHALAPAEVVAAAVSPAPAAVLWDGFRYRAAWIEAGFEGSAHAAIVDISGFTTPSRPTLFPVDAAQQTTSMAVAQGQVALAAGSTTYISEAWRPSSALIRSEPHVLLTRTRYTTEVAAVWAGDRYLVAWGEEGRAIVVRAFDRQGNPLGEPRTVLQKVEGTKSAIVDSIGALYVPYRADPIEKLQLLYGSGRVALVWEEDGRTIRGMRLAPDGRPLDDAPFDIGSSRRFSAATDGYNVHVVFRTDEDCCTIFGRRFPFHGRVEDEAPIAITTRPSEAFEPRIAYDGSQFALLVSDVVYLGPGSVEKPAPVIQTPLVATMTRDWALSSWTPRRSFMPQYGVMPLAFAAHAGQFLVLAYPAFDVAWNGDAFVAVTWDQVLWHHPTGAQLAHEAIRTYSSRGAVASPGDGTALVVVHDSTGTETPLVGRIVHVEPRRRAIH